MATISGRIVFDKDRNNLINFIDSGIANVPVVLQAVNSGLRITASTDGNGNYSFINVAPVTGGYRIVESYGEVPGPNTADFNLAIVGPIPLESDPPLGFVTNPPTGSTNLDSITPNMIFVNVSGPDIINQNFLDGPVIYTPITSILDSCATIIETNLITAADNGTFGTFLAGTAANTGAPGTALNPPYPGVTPGFDYVLASTIVSTPEDGQYTIQNIMNNSGNNRAGGWWRIADHTTGIETGRMLVVNGSDPGAIIFTNTISVSPNTNYLFTAWILNLIKNTTSADPKLGVQILDQNNNIIYNQNLENLVPPNINAPEWKQIGTTLNTQNNTQITVQFISQGPAATGNDFAIDDIKLQPISIPNFIPKKTVSPSTVNVGEIVTYIVTLENTCDSPLTNVIFQDIVPQGLTFVPESVLVNMVPNTISNPNFGFNIGTIPGMSTTTITFSASAISIPNPNPTDNIATMNYLYTPIQGGIPNLFIQTSNTVPVKINNSTDISVVKTGNPSPVTAGEILTYTIVVTNLGPSNALDVILTDTISPCLLNPKYSIDGGSFDSWPTSVNLGTIVNGATISVNITGTVNPSCSGTIVNTAIVTSTTPDPNPNNNQSTKDIEVKVYNPKLDLIKCANKSCVFCGDIVTYKIVAKNSGDIPLGNVELKPVFIFDALSPNLEFAPGSVKVDGVPRPQDNIISGVNLGVLDVNQSKTIIFEARVVANNATIIKNIATSTFGYQIPGGNPRVGSSTSNEVNISISNFEKFIIKQRLAIQCKNPCIESINEIDGNIEILKECLVKTHDNAYLKCQHISSYKLEICGILKISVEYESCNKDYCEHYDIPFSNFMDLPDNYIEGKMIIIDYIVEDICYELIDCRSFIVNAFILIKTRMAC